MGGGQAGGVGVPAPLSPSVGLSLSLWRCLPAAATFCLTVSLLAVSRVAWKAERQTDTERGRQRCCECWQQSGISLLLRCPRGWSRLISLKRLPSQSESLSVSAAAAAAAPAAAAAAASATASASACASLPPSVSLALRLALSEDPMCAGSRAFEPSTPLMATMRDPMAAPSTLKRAAPVRHARRASPPILSSHRRELTSVCGGEQVEEGLMPEQFFTLNPEFLTDTEKWSYRDLQVCVCV